MRAREADSLAAFGGIVGLNRRIDVATAKAIVSTFIEAVIAPDVDADARPILATKANLRVLAVDLARFAAALRDPTKCPLLKAETWRELHAAPPAPVSRQPDGSLQATFYACGWSTRPVGHPLRGANYWHTGSLPGTYTLLVRRWDGLAWAALFNQRSKDRKLDGELDPALHRAADAVKEWPKEDLFARFG